MSNILITGMTAPHASATANANTLSFAGVLRYALATQGHTVVQTNPDITWTVEDLDKYDVVMVGVSPLTSLSANHIYGALHTIDLLLDSPRLKLFIDAPEPTRITTSLRAMKKNPDNLVKPFYSNRRGYSVAVQTATLARLHKVIDHLLENTWPTVLYPALPWDNPEKTCDQLPAGALSSLVGINLDAYLIDEQLGHHGERSSKWVVDNYSTPWTKSTTATLQKPTVPMRWHKGWTDAQAQAQIAAGIGALITPYYSGGTWWSYRYVQCLNVLTPIATGWQDSGLLGSGWALLASTIEDMTQEQRDQLATEQRESYIAHIPSRRDAAIQLTDTLDLYAVKGK